MTERCDKCGQVLAPERRARAMTEEEKARIRWMVDRGVAASALAQAFGVTVAAIENLDKRRGKITPIAKIPGGLELAPPKRKRSRSKRGRRQ